MEQCKYDIQSKNMCKLAVVVAVVVAVLAPAKEADRVVDYVSRFRGCNASRRHGAAAPVVPPHGSRG